MEKKVLAVCGIVGILGAVSAVFAFAAEATKIKNSDVNELKYGDDCPSSPASWLGIVSAIALLTDQFIITAITGCFCCQKNQTSSTNKPAIGLCGYIIHWVTFCIAFTMLLVGAAANVGSKEMDNDDCWVIMDGYFSGAAILAIGSVALGLVYYVSWSSLHQNPGSDGMGQDGVAIGVVALSPQQQNQGLGPNNGPSPVFVQEDTHHRRHQPENQAYASSMKAAVRGDGGRLQSSSVPPPP